MPIVDSDAVPATMHAAVYKGRSIVAVEEIPTPRIGTGELLVRVEACGICHTDLKKIEYDLLTPPRVYGHETAGVVVQVGQDVAGFAPGDRVVVFHHIPCMDCFYCRKKVYAQCPTYKKVGVTAGYEPAGGGFSQYVRVMDWIVRRGVEKIPAGVSFERAAFRRAGQYLPQGRGSMRSAARRTGGGGRSGSDRADVYHAGAAYGGHRGGHRHHSSPPGALPEVRRKICMGSPPDGRGGGNSGPDRGPRRRFGDSGRFRPRNRGSRRFAFPAPVLVYYYLHKLPIPNGLRFPGPVFVWASGTCSAVTAPPSICRKSRRISCSAALCRWKS